MSLTINTNIASLQAQNNLSQVNKSLEQNQERLSSGLRINSAADDAAGLAITDRMTAQIKGMNQASRNANDGISMFQTAEGGMNEITNILQRMRELGVQSANESNTTQDRESLNQEFDDLKSELNRIAESTTFNGQNILNGDRGEADFQVGADTGDVNRIKVDMDTSMESSEIGARAEGTLNMTASTGASTDAISTISDGDLSVNDVALDNLSDFGDDFADGSGSLNENKGKDTTSAYAIAEAINAKSEDENVDLNVSAEASGVEEADLENSSVTGSATSYTLNINGVDVVSGHDLSSDLTTDDLVDKINNNESSTGVHAEKNDDGTLKLSSEDGANINIKESNSGSSSNDVTTALTTTSALSNGEAQVASYRGEVKLESEEGDVTINNGGTQVFEADVSSSEKTFNASYLEGTNILDQDNARSAIEHIDSAIDDVDSFRATMGAAQNRMESTIANLENASQNLTEARSRIEDADIAKESSEQTMNNVRRQASAAVLTQANQSPQLALQLLGG